MDAIEKARKNTLLNLLAQIESLSEEDQKIVWGGLEPAQRTAMEQVKVERDMMQSIGDTLGGMTISFASDDDPEEDYSVNLVTKQYE